MSSTGASRRRVDVSGVRGTFEHMSDDALRGDPGDDLSVAAVEALRSSAAVRACAEAVELRAIATLVQVRRAQARVASHRCTAVRRREAQGRAARPALVDLEAVDGCTAQEVTLALWLSPVAPRSTPSGAA